MVSRVMLGIFARALQVTCASHSFFGMFTKAFGTRMVGTKSDVHMTTDLNGFGRLNAMVRVNHVQIIMKQLPTITHISDHV